MTQKYILALADSSATLANVGGKGASLARLVNAGLPVPDGFHVTTEAYKKFVAENNLQSRILAALYAVDVSQPATLETAARTIGDLFANAPMPQEIADAITRAYTDLGNLQLSVAVRSSATAEDLPDLSFAGQQETYLNIEGVGAVQDAVKRCWASLWTPRAIGYRTQHKIAHEAVALAVVVQILVNADVAGILFTSNPVNGARDQVVINAAWGLGEAIVGGAVTPDTFIVEKTTERIIERQIADKPVMTVRVARGTEEHPVPENLRRASALSDDQTIELARLGARIEKLYGMPMDIEWTLAQNRFAIVQARPITALPEPPVSIEWKLPNPKGQYMRGSVVDLLPNPVSPLFATLAIPAISRVGIKGVLKSLTRSEPELPEDYISTINGYAYMGIAYSPRQWWWIFTKMMTAFPRMLREALPLWRDKIRPQYVATVARWQTQVSTLTNAELWTAIHEINHAAMLHLASLLVATTGASAGAEMLFTRVYDKMIRRKDDPAAATFLMGYDSTPIRAEKSLYDVAMWCQAQEYLATYVKETPTTQLVAELANGTSAVAGWPEFCERFQTHLHHYGHIIYDLDFAKPLPLDDPTPMLETIKMYLRGQGVNPHVRQHTAEEKRVQSAEEKLKQLKWLRRWVFRKTLGVAQTMAAVRESALADIGLGYPLLRDMLRELGHRLAQAGMIIRGEDIFWLEANELSEVITAWERGESVSNLNERVARRKATHTALEQVTPPPMLPPRIKYLGIDTTLFTPATAESQTGNLLKGVAASSGKTTAPACVLHGPADFDQMRPGDVLVAATTTPAWTPLFAMASGVVTDIGGPLSHGSIVAREYGIPAVMGTGVATKRILSGQVITVDGSAGTVTLSKD